MSAYLYKPIIANYCTGAFIVTREKSCGALVYSRFEGKLRILVLRHRLGGHWSFPKGHVEEGETEIETALREVREETGLSIQLHDGFREQITYFPRPDIIKEVVYFLGYAENSKTIRQVEEISEIRWVDLKKIGAFLTYDNDRLLIRSAKRFLRAGGLL